MGEACERMYGAHCYVAHRADLLAHFQQALPRGQLRLDHRCTGVAQDASGVEVTFASRDGSESRIQQMVDEVRREVAVVVPPAFNRFQHSFSHIFSGGYAAGYYSYKWAEVLSADAWSAFEESGPLDPGTGRRYREAILETGGSRPAMESFKAFRGREPRIDALLRHQGMA